MVRYCIEETYMIGRELAVASIVNEKALNSEGRLVLVSH